MWLLWVPLVLVHVYNGILSRAMIAANRVQHKTLILELLVLILLAFAVHNFKADVHMWFYSLTILHLIQINGKQKLIDESSK